MAIFLCAYAFAGGELPTGLEGRLLTIVGSAGHPVVTRGASSLLVHVELGMWPESAVRAEGHSRAVVAGDPVFCARDRPISRAASVDAVARIALDGEVSALEQAEGSYFAVGLDARSGRLLLAVDKLGVRPIYVGIHANVVYASSALWMLEQLSDLPKRCDWRGITEAAAFGYPLADRTPYVGISALASGSALVCTQRGVALHTFWDWRQPMSPSNCKQEDPLLGIERAFYVAVDDRLGSAKRALAFLSGGMDSRLLASHLRQRGVMLDTLNFAPTGSADLVYGKLAAEAMGTRHFEYDHGESAAAPRAMEALAAWRGRWAVAGDTWAAGQRLVWSGEGGSVSLGHVYLSDEIVRIARAEGLGRAAEAIQRQNKCQVSARMFTSGYRRLANVPLEGIRDELHRNAALEPGRACHMFFMLNDQRRHLANHYENIHRLRIDYHLPFFDGRLARVILTSAIDPFLRHRLYNRLFERLPFGLGRVPWQSYPGHEPCPVANSAELRQQWSDGWFDKKTFKAQRAAELAVMARRLCSAEVPTKVLAKARLAVALKLTKWGVRDYSYLLASAKPFLSAHSIAGDC